MTFHVLFDLCDVGSVVNTATFSINSEEKHGEKTLFILNKPVSFSINLGLAIIPATSQDSALVALTRAGCRKGIKATKLVSRDMQLACGFWSFSVGFPSKQPGIH